MSLYPHLVAGHPGVVSYRRRRRRIEPNHPRLNCDEEVEEDEDSLIECVEVHESTLLKPIPIEREKGRREQRFYESLEDEWRQLEVSDSTIVSSDANWLSFFPRYYGTLIEHTQMQQTSQTHQRQFVPMETHIHTHSTITASPVAPHFLHLTDLTASFTHPSLIDIKIGRISYDPFECHQHTDPTAALCKIERERLKCPTQVETGFRICGARIWQSDQNTYQVYDKSWTKSFTMNEIEMPFWIYFGHRPSKRLAAMAMRPTDHTMRTVGLILPTLLARLRQLLHLCQTQPRWRFYASSVLCCYQLQPQPQAQLHLIDFGHVYPIQDIPPILGTISRTDPVLDNLDSNYIVGIQSLINIFDRMLKRAVDTVGLPGLSLNSPAAFHSRPDPTRLISPSSSPLKLHRAIRSHFLQRKTISALLRHLSRRVNSNHERALLLECARDRFHLITFHTHLKHEQPTSNTTLHLNQHLIRLVFNQSADSSPAVLSLLASDELINTSFTRPTHTTNHIYHHGHRRTRKRYQELKQAKLLNDRQEQERMKRGLSLAAFKPNSVGQDLSVPTE